MIKYTTAVTFNYAEALQKSIFFYECQFSGEKPSWNRVEWRATTDLDDGKDVGKDLSGGWYDAGDHVKFGFPMAATATLLAVGVIEFEEGYVKSKQMKHILNNLKFVCDYFVKCHTTKNEFWGQVGKGHVDHAWWGPAECMPMKRPSYKIDASNPGSDLAGGTAAALAASSIVFRKHGSQEYADNLLKHAKELYEFADKYRGVYHESITDATTFYRSWSGYHDELVWGAIWLYMATDDKSYLDKAETYYDSLGNEGQSQFKKYKWTHCWDDKGYGCYVYLAKITGKSRYKEDSQRWLDYWSPKAEVEGIKYTPGGLAWLDTWGALRYAANSALFSFIYSNYLKENGSSVLAKNYHDFAVKQINYALGDNPADRSYVCGFGKNPPINPHHRTAHGSWSNSLQRPKNNRHILYGALVGGPDQSGKYTDDRSNFITNEVACDYNAAFTGALAAMTQEFGGTPLDNFPQKEKKEPEIFVMAKVNASGPRHIEISAKLHNRSAWPARSKDNLSIRYFVNLSEVFAAGHTLQDIKINTNHSGASGISELISYDKDKNIYYVEIYFKGVLIAPISASDSRVEVQFRLSLPTNTNKPEWDNSNDYSFDKTNLDRDTITYKIPVYDSTKNGRVRIFGYEPGDSSEPVAVRSNFSTSKNITGDIIHIYPNHNSRSIQIVFNLKKQQLVNISLFNLKGEEIIRKEKRIFKKGNNTVNLSTVPYTPGLYILKIKAENIMNQKKINIFN
ncbi:MAG: glycoside hydrolase family 9 protein [Chitinispirillia bacterium]